MIETPILKCVAVYQHTEYFRFLPFRFICHRFQSFHYVRNAWATSESIWPITYPSSILDGPLLFCTIKNARFCISQIGINYWFIHSNYWVACMMNCIWMIIGPHSGSWSDAFETFYIWQMHTYGFDYIR